MMVSKDKGTLYLIPTPLAEGTIELVIPPHVISAIKICEYFLVEDLRTARRFLSSLNLGLNISELTFEILNKDSSKEAVNTFLQKVPAGKNIGVLSDAGCPGIADPGALAASCAHETKMRVVPLAGPSSILLALMASGFNGQSFTFHGYLPIPQNERVKKILQMESDIYKKSQTQIFMDTPYRNNSLILDIINNCKNETKLCVAANLTGSEETILTMKISEWKKKSHNYHKQPAMLLLYY